MNDSRDLELEISKLKAELDRVKSKNRSELDQKANVIPANFVQISRPVMKEISALSRTNALALDILFLFGQKMNRQNAIMVSQKALCLLTDKSRQSVYNALKVLEQGNWLKKVKVGTANAYVVNSRVFWSSTTQNRKYAQFTATIITTEEEQDQTAEEWDAMQTKHFPLLDHTKERILLGTEEIEPPDQGDINLD